VQDDTPRGGGNTTQKVSGRLIPCGSCNACQGGAVQHMGCIGWRACRCSIHFTHQPCYLASTPLRGTTSQPAQQLTTQTPAHPVPLTTAHRRLSVDHITWRTELCPSPLHRRHSW
jgi:hypothetical protein